MTSVTRLSSRERRADERCAGRDNVRWRLPEEERETARLPEDERGDDAERDPELLEPAVLEDGALPDEACLSDEDCLAEEARFPEPERVPLSVRRPELLCLSEEASRLLFSERLLKDSNGGSGPRVVFVLFFELSFDEVAMKNSFDSCVSGAKNRKGSAQVPDQEDTSQNKAVKGKDPEFQV